jgi:hypothetical protein
MRKAMAAANALAIRANRDLGRLGSDAREATRARKDVGRELQNQRQDRAARG